MSTALRDFGGQWLRGLDEDWKVLRARYIFSERKDKSRADDVHLTPSQKYAVLPQAEYMKLTGGRVVLNLTGADNMKHVEDGDFVIHLRSFQGGIEYSKYRGKVSNAYTVLSPHPSVVSSFYRYVLKSEGFISELAHTTDQLRDGQSIKFSQLDLIDFPLPTASQQGKIADFLDTETAKIDDLIAKQERLLQLLEEKRRATITHAVTRGLNPHAELKETNIPWLGKIPLDRKVVPVKVLAKIRNGYPFDSKLFSDKPGTPLLRIRDLNKYEAETFYGGAYIKEAEVTKDDVLIGMDGDFNVGRWLGDEPALLNQRMCALRASTDTLTRYLEFALASPLKMINDVTYATTVKHLASKQVMDIKVALPDNASELTSIVNYIDGQLTSLDGLKQKIQTQISLLRERRTSLISHVVTGKVMI